MGGQAVAKTSSLLPLKYFFLLKISDSNRLRKIYFQKRKGTESLLRDVEDGINCWPRKTDTRN